MIKLENVSKFYYSKGMIATGFTKVNVSFNVGEFVAITGESGSGKSTLLNVISGLDTYEEGEMYINGEETSHYTEKDFEEYRRKYIGNIYQNFNLINSYTVYENIELAMLLNGYKKSEIKQKVNEIIEKVNLTEFKNTKVSKLSGGQKQRVSIARALAKETPIIIADEPTGNLDVASANEIFAILHDISKNKLVIIVTHNYEQVEKYVTRKIRMHDGMILEDLKLNSNQEVIEPKLIEYKKISLWNTIRLGIRNTFNLVPKFVLLLAVFLFITAALLTEYSVFKKAEFNDSMEGYNWVFNKDDTSRIILKKEDGTPFSDEDFNRIQQLDNIKHVVKNDLSLDSSLEFSNDELWIDGSVMSMDGLTQEELTYGRLPEAEYEIVVKGHSAMYSLQESTLGATIYRMEDTGYEYRPDQTVAYKVVGIIHDDSSWNSVIYIDNSTYDLLTYKQNQSYSTLQLNFLGHLFDSESEYSESNYGYSLVPREDVPAKMIWVSDEFNEYAPYHNAVGDVMSIKISNLYYTETSAYTVDKVYNANNCKQLLGIDKKALNTGCIYMNMEDYQAIFDKETYQSSVFVKDKHYLDQTLTDLQKLGIHTLALRDAHIHYNQTEIIAIMRTIVTIALVVVLFYISYFVIRIIFRSRNIYFTIIRMLGGSQKVARNLLVIELFVIAVIAELIALGAIFGQVQGYYSSEIIEAMITYLTRTDYIILFILPVVMSIFIGFRYASKLFKNSTMVTMREEQ